MTRTTRQTIDLDRYDAEETRDDAQHLAGLSAAEKREIKRALDCGSSGHPSLAAMWRSLTPSTDGRLHATCPICKSHVSRAAFIN
jgi:hypothetical protein